MAQASFYCPQCKQMKLFQGENMNHTAHILASVFLCGLWLPIWLIMAATYQPQYRCNNCGFNDALKYLYNPELRKIEARQNAERKSQREYNIAHSTGAANFYYRYIESNVALIAAGTAVFLLFIFVAIMASNSHPQPVEQPPTKAVKAVTSNDVADYLRTNQNNLPFYRNIKTVGVEGDAVVAVTDLPAKNENLLLICGALSRFLYFSQETRDKNIVRVFDKNNKLAIERLNYQAPCEFKK